MIQMTGIQGDFLRKLERIVGPEHVIADDRRAFYATDVYHRLESPAAVVQPGTQEELVDVIACAYAEDIALFPRGGGASYTAGYLPSTPRAIQIDVGRLNRIIEINEEDMYVSVEPGVTWAVLEKTLKEKGLRTPFRGPFSGLVATVGGSISQNTLGFGTNTWGVSCDSVLAVEAVVADGKVIKTGQAGSMNGKPFYRYYGPDTTALYTGDCGALGVKSLISLKMIKVRPHSDCISFGFDTFKNIIAAQSEIAGYVIEEKSFALDTALQQGQIGKSSDTATRLSIAKSVVAAADNPFSGALQVIRMGLSGTKALLSAPYAAHYMFEGLSKGEVRGKANLLRRIATQYGREIPNSVPFVVRATPFAPLHNILGPAGERWVPLHGIVPHSSVLAFQRELQEYLDTQKDAMSKCGVYVGLIFSALGSGAFLIEPAFYWTDEKTAYHEAMLDQAYKAEMPSYPANPKGAALVQKMREAMIEQFHRYGAGHLQVGKQYPLLRDRNPEAVSLLRAIKQTVDPKNLINPGALGL